jgi:hypothetical protein
MNPARRLCLLLVVSTLSVSGLMAADSPATQGSAQTRKPAKMRIELEPEPAAKSDAGTVGANQGASEDAKTKAVKVEDIVLPGIVRPRADGYISLRVEGGNWLLAFYDSKKKPLPLDVQRGSARWNPSQKSGDAFCVLNPGGESNTLVGNRFVQPPRIFKVYVTLTKGEDAKENFVFEYREPLPAASGK